MAEVLVFEDADVRIDRYSVGPYDNKVYVLRCKSTGEGILVDAANEPEVLLRAAKAAEVRTILTTHGHFDHIQAVAAMRDAGYMVGIGEDDATMLASYDYVIRDDDVTEVGRMRLHAMHTPGHTPGSTCFSVEGRPVLVSGDTLFPGGPGKTPDKLAFDAIIDSIERRIFPLSDETLVLPGHGDWTTVGAERPHLPEWVARGW
ncbi:MAG: MBL fold metallo-hydrolase [Acidimicrobiia bacterium]